MGGLFTIVKVRSEMKSYDEDPGWYKHPAGTMALQASDEELRRDGIDVSKLTVNGGVKSAASSKQMGMEAIKSEPISSLFWQGIEVERCTGKLKMISESITLEGGEFEWPTRTVLTGCATAKLNRAKASRKAAIHTAVIIAPILCRLLQASANVDTRGAIRRAI